VQLDFPTTQERIMAAGGEVPVHLWDVPGTDWKQGDVVQILSIDGHSSAIHPDRYAVGLVERLPGPLSITAVQLTGMAGAQP
jgi:hypothetical protein